MSNFTNEYLDIRKKRLVEETPDGDKSSVPYRSIALPETYVTPDKYTTGDIGPLQLTAEQRAEHEAEMAKTWFDTPEAFKDGYQFGDISKTIHSSAVDLVRNVGAGALKIGEGAIDTGAWIVGGVGKLFGADDFAEGTKEFIKQDLIPEKDVAKWILTPGATIKETVTGVDAEANSVFGEHTDELAQSGGQLLATAGLQAVGVPWWATTAVTSFGSEVENAFNQDATYLEAGISAAISAGAEIVTEKISGGIKFGGKTFDEGTTKLLARGISNKFVRTLAKLGVDMAGEGGEEFLSSALSRFGQWLTYQDDKTLGEMLFSEEAFDEYLNSFIGGAVLGGGSNVVNTGKAHIQGVDSVTGLKTDTEQKVVDKLYKDALAEAEKAAKENGTKVTRTDKAKLYDSVLNNLEKGYIKPNVIEDTLAGESYKAYKDAVTEQETLQKEYDELYNMKNADKSNAQIDREAALKSQLEEITSSDKILNLKNTLDSEIANLVKDTKLAESYNEQARRGQAYEADLSKYSGKQAEIIQKAIDSGILNNTNRTHEFVDMVSKISAQKGVLFDFANNEKIKESGFAIEGKTVNGYVTKDGVTLNIDSAKSLNSVVGHEISHVLEGTELYQELQTTIVEYAKSKGDYQARYDALKELYKNIKDADIDAELTADLVGDYLFTDKDFVNNLSVQHRNVFQKIYDEIKYLWKTATAGSKEKRELEKVKKVFEQAYKESGKASEGTKYSVSDKKIINKLTGAELEGNTYKVLNRLSNGETVTSDEIANLKEVKEGDAKSAELRQSFIAEHSEFANVPSDHVGTYLLNDEGRIRLREKIISERLQEGSFTGIDKNGNEVYNGSVKQDKRLDIVIGLPASGKSSSIVNPLSQYYQSAVIDSDIIKQKLPEFNGGWGAMLVHEESSLINSQLLEQSMNLGNNIVLPVVGSKVSSVERYIAIANKMGYSVNVHLNELSNGKAVGRMLQRYFDTGRFINPAFVADYGNRPTEVYEQIKQRGDISGYSRWNNDVPRGQRPILVDVSESNRLYASYNGTSGQSGRQLSGRLAESSEQTAKLNNEIAPIKEASSSDGVFFDGKNPKYSLSEYTAEEKKAHNDAVVKHFGRTYKWAETGYLLLDGTKLDLSGKHDGAPGGYRTVDHRDITEALGYDYGGGEYSDSLIQFMSEGNIRIIPEIDGINLSVKPTKAQEQALTDYISRVRGEVVLDIDDLDGYTVVSVEYPSGTRSTKILNDIREWFDNGVKPENAGNYSLTKEGSTPKRYGNYNVFGKDIGLAPMPTAENVQKNVQNAPENVQNIAPVAEAVAPTVDKAVDNTYPEGFAPIENAYTVEQEIERVREEMRALNEQYNRLKAEGKETEANALIPMFMELNEKAGALYEKSKGFEAQERADTEGYLNSLTDADAPPEIDAPYFEDGGIINPFDERDVKTVGDRKVKSFMAENPEVKPYFQAEANILLGELNNSIKGERFYTQTPDGNAFAEYGAESYGVWSGTSRHVTPDIERLLDNGKGNGKGYSYDEIRAGLQAIIEDNGKENNACSKRIEFIINDRLMNGYITDGGYDIPANQEYRDLIKSQGVLEGREEAFKQLLKDTNKSERAQMEDIAPLPTYNTASEKQIPGQQTLFEDNPIKEAPTKNTAAEAPTEEPKIAKVLTEEPKTDKKNRDIWSAIKNNVFDKGMIFEDISLKTGNRELQAKWNSIRYAKSRAQQLIGNGDGNVKSLTSIQEKVEKSGKKQEFYDYLYHLHNVDRMSLEAKAAPTLKAYKEKFGHLKLEQIQAIALKEITDKTTERTANTIREAKEYLQALDTKNKAVFGDEVTADISRAKAAEFEKANPEFKAWAQDVYDYMNNLRQMLVDEGVISQETADLWAEIYPHYVPIRRAGKDGPAINVALDSNKTGINAPIKRATGGNSDILPLFDTMALRTEQTYRAIAKNRFGVELKNTLGTTIDRGDISLDDAIDNLDNDEGLLKKGENGANPTFTVFEDGKRVEFEITEEMYDAIKPAGKVLSYTNKVANTVNNVFRGLLTEYNPVFMVTNGIKDAQDVLMNSQHAAKTYANIPVAIKEMATKGHWYKEYIANGGEQNTYFDDEAQTFKKEDKGIKKVVGMPLRAISAVNNTIERLPRLAEYIASRKSGASEDVSMLDAARVTTNFAAGGDLTKMLNRNGFTFLNASMQGFVQQGRNLREAKANGRKGWLQLATKTAIAGIPALILNDLLWDDDEEYEELSDYIKQDYYIVAKTEDGKFVRIPKGRTVAVIQDGLEQMKNLITGDDEVDMNSFNELFWGNLAPNNPLENNIIAPIIQVMNNKTWYGEDLVPSRLQDLPDAEQYDETTDSISKWLGEKLNLSPYKINYLLNQYSGGIGDVALPMLTPESDGSGVLAPFADKFTTDSTMKNQNVTDFYDTVDELTKNANSANATDEDILKNKYMGTIRTELGELYAQKREIQNSDLSDKEKDELVREIQEEINAKAKESLDTYGDVRIDGGYATVGDLHYRWYEPSEDSDAEPGWEKITDKQLEKQEKVTRGLGITPSEYWGNKEEYDFAYESPGKYAVAKSVGGYGSWKSYSSELYDIKADKDSDGKSINGSRKEKVINWLNEQDLEYGERLILFKSEYKADDTYNYDIIDYLNSRDDISYKEMETILKELGFTVDSEGYITWD